MNLWWRDDDAGVDDPGLDRVLAIAADRRVPVALAVIPALLRPETRDKIQAASSATVVQHGYDHHDFGTSDGKKCELVDRGGHPDERLVQGRAILAEAFGARFRPVMVPPWNRIEPQIRARLPALGYPALSTFRSSRPAPTVTGLKVVDTHVDAVLWRDGRRHLAADEIVAQVLAAAGTSSGPIGLLTHHAVTDEDGFAALDRAVAILQDRHRARFLSVPALFPT